MSNYRIIVVDDEVGIIESLSVVLNRGGYETVGETDPMKAIERIKNEHFDLLILDYLMFPYMGMKWSSRSGCSTRSFTFSC